MRRLAIALILAAATSSSAYAQATVVDRWLVLGPIPAAAPFGAASDSALLDATRLGDVRRWPGEGDAVALPDGTELRWQAGNGAAGARSVVFAAAYLEANAWQKAKLEIGGGDAKQRRVWLDGVRTTAAEVELTPGKHFLLVQQLAPAASSAPLTATLTPSTPGVTLAASLSPRRPGTWRDFHDVVAVTALEANGAGTRVAAVLRQNDPDEDRSASRLEVRNVADGRLLGEVRTGDPASPSWAPDDTRLAYIAATDRRDGAGRDLMIWDASSGESRRVLRGEQLTSLVGWSPDGSWIYYTGLARRPAASAPKPGDVRRLTEVWQRFDSSPEKLHLYAVNAGNGLRVTLVGDSTFGVAGAALSPDGKTIVFSRSAHTREARPWVHAELWTLDVGSVTSKRLLSLEQEVFNAPSSFAWSPDSRALAFCGSAKEVYQGSDSTFSAYESELYATPLASPRLVHLSGDGFVPSVGVLGCRGLTWNAADGRIYVNVDAGARTVPARTKRPVTSAVEKTTLEELKMPAEVVAASTIAGRTLVAAVEGPTTPPAIVRVDLATGASAPVAQPNANALAGVDVPAWRPWGFRNSRGEDIEAWYWTPPGFDSTRTYPMLVHYYGGTLPMKKNFEERLLWFASNGYVVLYMNPAGAPGYGQKFSNYHINDWGYPAATDIIEGTQQFLSTHRFVDPARVGNFGHSYGGFMTMHVLTRTKLFRTGIELAGISNIANYWGAGASGYSYTDGTCPGCYPWNRKDLYVDRSPLFQADRITAPLLLIHGTDDTNVVPTESEQMFTALRMLGREAELVRFAGENHGINSKPSVALLRDRIMLDWYEKYLKDRPAAWAARWGEAGGGAKVVTGS